MFGHRLLAIALVLSAAFSSAACHDNGSGSSALAAPSAALQGPRFIARGDVVQPAVVDVHSIADPLCAPTPAFLAPFSLILGGGGVHDLVLSRIEMDFLDTTGARRGSFAIAQPEIVTRFGSTRIPAFGTRTFPLAFPLGCGGFFPGTLDVVVVTGDPDGRTTRRRFEIPVRHATR
jgi:hypothetical protein